jgi:hypothetical protein
LWLVLLSKNDPLWSRSRNENWYSFSSHLPTTRTNQFYTSVVLLSSPQIHKRLVLLERRSSWSTHIRMKQTSATFERSAFITQNFHLTIDIATPQLPPPPLPLLPLCDNG